MSNARTVSVLTLLWLSMAMPVSQHAEALPQYLETAQASYSFKPGGRIEKAQCNLCHSGAPSRTHLNLYGKDVQSVLAQGSPKHLTSAALASIESKDSDGDGSTNGDELRSDTLPGDPTDHPAGAVPAKTQPTVVPPMAETNSFSLQMTLLAKNSQHPAMVHFPIALFMFSLFLDLMGMVRKQRSLHDAARYNLIAAAVTSVATMITGLMAWKFKLLGSPIEGDLRLHIVLAVTSSVLLFALWAVRTKQGTIERPLSPVYLILAGIALITIAITGHLGGVVSGVAG